MCLLKGKLILSVCLYEYMLQHLAIVAMDHLILQRLCQLTEKDAVIQPLHQTVSSEVHIYTHTCTIDYYKLFITMG